MKVVLSGYLILDLRNQTATMSPKTGDFVGTLRYMAPERFKGTCDEASDIYGLGLTLYELLALRPPFDITDRLGAIKSIVNDEPPRLRKIDPRIPRDIETNRG